MAIALFTISCSLFPDPILSGERAIASSIKFLIFDFLGRSPMVEGVGKAVDTRIPPYDQRETPTSVWGFLQNQRITDRRRTSVRE